MKENIGFLKKMANLLRKDVIEMVYKAKDGHPGPALSIAEIISVLYFSEMNVDVRKPDWAGRDRFILSKGHACPVLYAALARKGFFSKSFLTELRSLGSILQGHPDMVKTPGIDMTSGSLGHGISIGSGMAAAARITGYHYYVYVIVGDGELEEGIIWESAMTAVKYKLGNLIVFIDNNGFQSGGSIEDISGLLPILPKWQAFGWHCQEIDGHNISEIIETICEAKSEREQPSVIIARTIKGKGVPFMENDNSWHKRVPTKEEFTEAIKVLGGDCC